MELSEYKKEKIKFVVRHYSTINLIEFDETRLVIGISRYKFLFLNRIRCVHIKHILPIATSTGENVYNLHSRTASLTYNSIIDNHHSTYLYNFYEHLEAIGIQEHIFVNVFRPMMSKIIKILLEEESQQELTDPISLIPVNGKLNSTFIKTKQSSWYLKLLKEYIEYSQSDNKSDIIENHYQEQARLHGLKFVKK